MTDHLAFDQLCDLADGALGANEATRARTHLGECAACAASFASLSALEQLTAALPAEIEPPAGLWRDVRAALVPQRNTTVTNPVRWSLPNLAAAAAVIAIASSALTAVTLRGRSGPSTAAVVAASPDGPTRASALPAVLARTEDSYARSVNALQRTLAERRDSLAPSTVATVERSLRVADSAIAEARAALAHDPGNTALVKLFASNYERKIDLLRRATELAPRT